jgi:hypothetical protein
MRVLAIRKIGWLAAAAVVIELSGAAPAFAGNSRTTDAPIQFGFFTLVGVNTDATYTMDEVAELQQQADDLQAEATSPLESPTDALTAEDPNDDLGAVVSDPAGREAASGSVTERGYKRRTPGRRLSDYIYDSDWVRADLITCYNANECRVESEVKLRLRQNVVGGSSKSWKMTLYAQTWYGSSAYVTWYEYQCAVNIKNATDKYCTGFKSDGADGFRSDRFYDGDVITHYFGSYQPVTKFPMEKLHVTWSSGTQAIGDDDTPGEKFRGYDVCVKATTTKLCSSSGMGG